MTGFTCGKKVPVKLPHSNQTHHAILSRMVGHEKERGTSIKKDRDVASLDQVGS